MQSDFNTLSNSPTVSERYLDENIRAVRVRSTFFPFVRWIASFGNTITIGYGAWLIVQGQFTVGGLIAYRGYGRYFFGPIDDLTQINDTVQRGVAAANRLFQVLDAPVCVTDAPDAVVLPRSTARLSLTAFHFATAKAPARFRRPLAPHPRRARRRRLSANRAQAKARFSPWCPVSGTPTAGAIRLTATPCTT